MSGGLAHQKTPREQLVRSPPVIDRQMISGGKAKNPKIIKNMYPTAIMAKRAISNRSTLIVTFVPESAAACWTSGRVASLTWVKAVKKSSV